MINCNSNITENALRVLVEIFMMLVQHGLGKSLVPLHETFMMHCLSVAYEQRSVNNTQKRTFVHLDVPTIKFRPCCLRLDKKINNFLGNTWRYPCGYWSTLSGHMRKVSASARRRYVTRYYTSVLSAYITLFKMW